ncbi:hypothetical protein [Nocardioides zhouii]|uniref:Uncharacterized protein n=1 Tax=Nocardioides zhouii TaxID=1168729 RepID=A0A4Q2SLP8_9ACTN|nr:hypothetical protein [Nocardioides zhouii]RYC05941.1 hypothetical protein EUA94_16955 [Nocardioides zhouii]
MSAVEVRLEPFGGVVLSAAQRERLALLADVVVAGGAGMPSASGAEVHTQWIDRVIAVRADLAEAVSRVLVLEGDPDEVLAGVRAGDPELFSGFAFAVAGAYLINPRVRRELGYPGPAPMKSPALPGEAEAYLEDGILDVVIARGPIYRPTPDAR